MNPSIRVGGHMQRGYTSVHRFVDAYTYHIIDQAMDLADMSDMVARYAGFYAEGANIIHRIVVREAIKRQYSEFGRSLRHFARSMAADVFGATQDRLNISAIEFILYHLQMRHMESSRGRLGLEDQYNTLLVVPRDVQIGMEILISLQVNLLRAVYELRRGPSVLRPGSSIYIVMQNNYPCIRINNTLITKVSPRVVTVNRSSNNVNTYGLTRPATIARPAVTSSYRPPIFDSGRQPQMNRSTDNINVSVGRSAQINTNGRNVQVARPEMVEMSFSNRGNYSAQGGPDFSNRASVRNANSMNNDSRRR
jgi:hypothetical protein